MVSAHGMAVAPLIFALRHEPATPYRWGAGDDARPLSVPDERQRRRPKPGVAELAEHYLDDLELPATGATCRKPKPFGATAGRARRAAWTGGGLIRRERRLGSGHSAAALVGC